MTHFNYVPDGKIPPNTEVTSTTETKLPLWLWIREGGAGEYFTREWNSRVRLDDSYFAKARQLRKEQEEAIEIASMTKLT